MHKIVHKLSLSFVHNIDRKNATTVAGVKLLGVPARVTVTNEYKVAVNLFLSCRGIKRVKEGEVVDTFYQIEKDGEVYHSKAYTRVSVRNSYTIKFKNPRKIATDCHMAKSSATSAFGSAVLLWWSTSLKVERKSYHRLQTHICPLSP